MSATKNLTKPPHTIPILIYKFCQSFCLWWLFEYRIFSTVAYSFLCVNTEYTLLGASKWEATNTNISIAFHSCIYSTNEAFKIGAYTRFTALQIRFSRTHNQRFRRIHRKDFSAFKSWRRLPMLAVSTWSSRLDSAAFLERLRKHETSSATAAFHRDRFLFALLAAAAALAFGGAGDGASDVAEW